MYLHCYFWITILCVGCNWCLKLVCPMVLQQFLDNLGQQRKCQCTGSAQFSLFLFSSCRVRTGHNSLLPHSQSSILNYRIEFTYYESTEQKNQFFPWDYLLSVYMVFDLCHERSETILTFWI